MGGINMKQKFLAIYLILTVLIVAGGIFLWQSRYEKKENIYVLYYPNKDIRLNWSNFQYLFPKDFDPSKTMEIAEILKLNENEKRLFDSIENQYYSQLHLLKENNGNNFYLTIDPNTSVFLKKIKKINKISREEIVDYPIISLDSLIKLIPGMEYFQLKDSDDLKILDDINFHIVVPQEGSDNYNIFEIHPIIEHYD